MISGFFQKTVLPDVRSEIHLAWRNICPAQKSYIQFWQVWQVFWNLRKAPCLPLVKLNVSRITKILSHRYFPMNFPKFSGTFLKTPPGNCFRIFKADQAIWQIRNRMEDFWKKVFKCCWIKCIIYKSGLLSNQFLINKVTWIKNREFYRL